MMPYGMEAGYFMQGRFIVIHIMIINNAACSAFGQIIQRHDIPTLLKAGFVINLLGKFSLSAE